MAESKPANKWAPSKAGKPKDFSGMYTSTTRKIVQKPTPTIAKPILNSGARPVQPVKYGKNGLPVKPNGVRHSAPTSRLSSPSSRQSSHEPHRTLSRKPSRASPQIRPVLSSDDDEPEHPRKRVRLDEPVDSARKIRDPDAFSATYPPYTILHAADIANNSLLKHGQYSFCEFFTALQEDEEDCPTIELEYPCSNATERYQLVKPVDNSDFRPLSEIVDNMKIVKEFYLDKASAEKVEDSEFGYGLVLNLNRAAKDNARAGAQQRFLDVVHEYNELVAAKRKDGTIVAKLDAMTSPLPLQLVEHIVKNQNYARTVSPNVETVREYKGFSDNVYGELLPKFLSIIFKETRLKSSQVFVDLGSGVGNCVLQAALEIGCESWGCEMMPNPAKLADAQAKEFPSRCRMWGIKPGNITLIQDDFTRSPKVLSVLKRADVVLVNNQAFNPDLNEHLKSIFLELKEGAQVVSLKYFRDPAHRVKESNINDLVNCLTVVEKERFSGMVSWTDDPGKWYLHVKDSTELRRAKDKFERAGRSRSST